MSIDPAHLRYAAAASPRFAAAAERPAGAGPAPGSPGIEPGSRTRPAPAPVDTVDLSFAAGPPPEVVEQLDAAAKVVRELAANQRELHFRADEHSSRIIIEVRDMSGNVLRTIPPSKALDIMTADSLEKERAWVA